MSGGKTLRELGFTFDEAQRMFSNSVDAALALGKTVDRLKAENAQLRSGGRRAFEAQVDEAVREGAISSDKREVYLRGFESMPDAAQESLARRRAEEVAYRRHFEASFGFSPD